MCSFLLASPPKWKQAEVSSIWKNAIQENKLRDVHTLASIGTPIRVKHAFNSTKMMIWALVQIYTDPRDNITVF